MKFNKVAPLGLSAALVLTTCKENKQVDETRAKVTATTSTSASPVQSASAGITSTAIVVNSASVKPDGSTLPLADAGIDAEPEKNFCRPQNVELPWVKTVPRSEWAPLPANLKVLGNMEHCNNYPIQKITIHHTGDWKVTKPGEGRSMASGAVYYHVNPPKIRGKKNIGGKGWGDVAYHYFVTPNGEILEGRNPAFRGDSNTKYYPNDKNHSHTPQHHLLIALVGNFEKEGQELTAKARLSLYRLLKASMKYYDLDASMVGLHKDVAYTGCPGEQVIDWFNTNGKYQIKSKPKLLKK